MRGLFELFSNFDWITPIIGFGQDIKNDPTLMQSNSWTFFIPYDQALNSGWNPFQIEDLLNRHGIKTWGGQLTAGQYFFSVGLETARWAEYIFLKYGIPLTEDSMGPPAPRRKKRKKRGKGADLSFIDDIG